MLIITDGNSGMLHNFSILICLLMIILLEWKSEWIKIHCQWRLLLMYVELLADISPGI